MPRILTLYNYYLPGWRAGGGTRAVANLVALLENSCDVYLVTRDHDEDVAEPYAGVVPNEWVPLSKHHVCYVRSIAPSTIWEVTRGISPDLIWLHSYFSVFTVSMLLLRRIGLISRKIPVVLSPHGELARDTINQKRWKKLPYRAAAATLGLYRGLSFHVANESEERDVRRLFPRADVYLVPHILPRAKPLSQDALRKNPGELRLLWLSRIDDTKNLLFLLESLRPLDAEGANITLTIHGPVNSSAYWRRCQDEIATFRFLRIEVRGALPYSDIDAAYAAAHFFVLPSMSESFGYSIVESWQHARPVLISQGTPWRGLVDKRVGWDLRLDVELWTSLLKQCLAMDNAIWGELCRASHELYAALLQESDASTQEKLRELLRRTLGGEAAS